MSDKTRQDTDDLRGGGNASGHRVPGAQEKSKTNEDYKTSFYAKHGYAAHHFLTWVERDVEPGHRSGWNNVADRYQNIHDASHTVADAFDHGDGEGGARIRKQSPDA